MPFAGTTAEAAESLTALASLHIRPRDALILADNSGTAPAPAAAPEVTIVPAGGEHSPARARNAGAAAAAAGRQPWLLFLDADCRPSSDLIDAFFEQAIPDEVGALAGEIHALPPGGSLAARYGAARNFLNTSTHMAHPFRPRLAAANLLVRRAAFDMVGGFREGIRAAEDTDFCWRLQDAGFTLAVRPRATAGHAYRDSLGGLRAQWRGYAAGRAWLGRAYPGFHPEPALHRALRRAHLTRLPGVGPSPRTAGAQTLPRARVNPGTPPRSARERLEFLFVDVLLGIEELRGLRRSNDA
jgi:GT2 family glycosyltransferase